jgi:hypothetical protein
VNAGVGGLVEQEVGDVSAADAGADAVAAEVAGADGAGRGTVGRAGERAMSGLSVTRCDMSSNSR